MHLKLSCASLNVCAVVDSPSSEGRGMTVVDRVGVSTITGLESDWLWSHLNEVKLFDD